MVHHGTFGQLARQPVELPLPDELAEVTGPVVLFFGLLRPYKALQVLLDAWREVQGRELWIVGRPRVALLRLQALAGPSVRFVPRFIADAELPGYFRRADVVVLPCSRTERLDQSRGLADALAFGRASVVTEIGGFPEVAAAGAAKLVAPDDPAALGATLRGLLEDPQEHQAPGRRCPGGGSRTVLLGYGRP